MKWRFLISTILLFVIRFVEIVHFILLIVTMSVLQTILNNICLQEESEDIYRGLDLGKCDQDVHEKECNGVVDIYVASKLC